LKSETDPLELIAAQALTLVSENSTIGLGTGRAASAFVRALGAKVSAGFAVRGVPTSRASAELAASLGLSLTTLERNPELDADFDGADEVDPQGNLIKGYGGALVREKIVATASRRLVILVGSEKLVPRLGTRGQLPVEVIPFALATCQRAIRGLGLEPVLRQSQGKPVLTDNGNHILDCTTGLIDHPEQLELALRAIPGLVGTGLFLGMKPTILVGREGRVEIIEH
jgi:ribose 5-phosphate isomerase A